MTDWKLLQELCAARGISGREDAVRAIILREVEGYADEVTVDPLGNVLIFKKGRECAKTKVMISAHMDEVGFLVTAVTEEGYLKFTPVGGIDQRVMAGRGVLVGDRALPGVIGVKPIHLLEKDEREKAVPKQELRIDIGAQDQKEALKAVQPGDMVTFCSLFDSSDGLIRSKAIDDRAGCAILLSLIKSDLPYDLHFAFVVQEEVGLRGAKAAAYTIDPQAAIVVEATTASDVAGVEPDRQVCRIGEGAVLSFMDGRTIYDREYYALAFQAAEAEGVKCQPKQAVAGGNDAGAIHVSRGGVRTLGVSLPCRYLHSAVGMIAKADFNAVEQVVREAARRIAGGMAE